MILSDYRVARRAESGLSGSWGLWSDEQRSAVDVVPATQRKANDMLAHLHTAERRRVAGQEKR